MHSIKETYITRISILYLNIQWINVGWHNYAPGLEALEHGRKRLGERLWWQEFRGPSLDHGDTNPGELLPKKRDFFTFENGEAQKKDRTTKFITNVYIILVYMYISPLSPLNKNKIYSIYHSTSHLSRNLSGKIIEINGAFSTLTPEGNHLKWEGGYFGTFSGSFAFFDEYPLSFGNLRGFWKWIYRWLWWSAKKCWCSVAILEKNPKGIMSENRIQPSKVGDDPTWA